MSVETDIVAALRSTDLFRALDMRLLRDLASRVEPVRLEKGESLFEQGAPADAAYVVVAGSLEVLVTRRDGSRVSVAKAAQGALVGEMQILTGGFRTAGVRAMEAAELLKIPAAAFKAFVDKAPAAADAMFQLIQRRTRRNELMLMLRKIFGSLHTETLDALERRGHWRRLERGEELFQEGDPGESMFFVVSGRLRAVARNSAGKAVVVGEIGRGECLGEMSVISGEPRSATIVAARQSELVELPRKVFEELVHQYPRLLWNVTGMIIERLRKSIRGRASAEDAVNIAVLPASPQVDSRDFTRKLASAISSFGSVIHWNSESLDRSMNLPGAAQTHWEDVHSSRIAAWLDEQEAGCDYHLYEADPGLSPWTQRCVHRADRILVVVRAGEDPAPGPLETELLDGFSREGSVRRTLVLLHPDRPPLPSGTHTYLENRRVEDFHHARRDRPEDFSRLARFLTGRAVGLVLGGGGARGFAHVGVVRAMRELGIPVDMVGGTSMGSVISAQVAMGFDLEAMVEVNRKSFVEVNPLGDYTLPLISLARSRRLDHYLRKVYGEVHIEDLWAGYFCISADLTAAEEVVHRTGPLWKAIRASVALPGVAVPAVEGDHLLVDGAVLNNLPGDVMRELCRGVVIAVDVGRGAQLACNRQEIPSPWKVALNRLTPFAKPLEIPNILEILVNTTVLSSNYKTAQVMADADLYLRPPVEKYKLLEFNILDEAVEAGYRYALERLREWKGNRVFA